MRTFAATWLLAGALLHACGATSSPAHPDDSPNDSGVSDAGAILDAAAQADSGARADSGAPADSGARGDSGAQLERDAGSPLELCDGSETLRFAAASSGGFLSPEDVFLAPFAFSYLGVRGDCSYVVGNGPFGEVRSGELAPARAAQLAAEVGFAHIREWSRFHDGESCPDAGGFSLHALGARVVCTCGCGMGVPDGLPAAMGAASAAIAELWEAGTPVSGAVTAVAYTPDMNLVSGDQSPQEWNVPWPIDRILVVPNQGVIGRGVKVEEGDGASELRILRQRAAERREYGQSFLVQTADGTIHVVLVRDELPPAFAGLPSFLR